MWRVTAGVQHRQLPHRLERSVQPRSNPYKSVPVSTGQHNCRPADKIVDVNHYRTIESSPVGLALLTYLQSNPEGWSGKLIDLLAYLGKNKPPGETNWPKSAKGMGDALRRLSPALRTLGFNCKSNQKLSGSITWDIKPITYKVLNQSPTSPTSPESPTEFASDLGHEGHAGHENISFAESQDENDCPF